MGGGADFVVGFGFDRRSLEKHFYREWEVSPEVEVRPEISHLEDRFDSKTGQKSGQVAVIDQKRAVRKAIKGHGYFYQDGRTVERVFQQFLASENSTCLGCWAKEDLHTCNRQEGENFTRVIADPGYYSEDFIGDILYRELKGSCDSYTSLVYVCIDTSSITDKIMVNSDNCRKNEKPYATSVISITKLREANGDAENQLGALGARLMELGLDVPQPTIGMVFYE